MLTSIHQELLLAGCWSFSPYVRKSDFSKGPPELEQTLVASTPLLGLGWGDHPSAKLRFEFTKTSTIVRILTGITVEKWRAIKLNFQ